MNYQAIGSGGGIQQITNKTVDFGNSDKPLKPADLDKRGLVQFPQVIISIVPVVNLPGIKPGELEDRRPDAGQHLSRQDHQVERSGASRS